MKKITDKKILRFFTLMEIMVAVAVLIVLMGFIFEFTIGAQRIWSATHARTTMTDEANAVLNVLSEDLMQMQVSSAAYKEIRWYYEVSGDNLSQLVLFVAKDGDTSGKLYKVNYYLDGTKPPYKLYRSEKEAWNKVGVANASDLGGFDSADKNDDHLVADNITKLEFKPADSRSNLENAGFTVKPKMVKLAVTVRTPEALGGTDSDSTDTSDVDLSFSRVIFAE
ncbi:MAG: hypothetical protein J6S21_06345 [Victivallales bacterium]|nr:hypothetical protein [Victivallales bacterium]